MCEQLQQLLSSVEDKRMDLSVYLCEDSSSFSIDELFNTIKTFKGLFLRAIKVSSQSESSVVSSQSESSVVSSQSESSVVSSQSESSVVSSQSEINQQSKTNVNVNHNLILM